MSVTYLGDKDGMYRRHSPYPILNQTKIYIDNGASDEHIDDSYRWESFYKNGCLQEEHLKIERMRVLIRDIPKMFCLKCQSKNVRIIYKQGNIHPMSGDAYYDVEIRCDDCSEYSAFSYAEN